MKMILSWTAQMGREYRSKFGGNPNFVESELPP
jgi:hypothetical protein